VKEPSLVRNLYLKENFTRTFFRSLSAGGLPWLMARRNAGIGGILSLHRICHPKPYEFASQAGLSVTPENFRRILQTLIGERGIRPKAGSTLLETARGRQIPDDERIAPGIAHQLHSSLHRRRVISGNGNCHFVSLPTGSALDGAGIALKARTNRVPGKYVSDSSDDAEPAHCAASLTHSRHGRGKTCRGKAGSLGLPSSCGAPRVLRIATG
jgi:hypothetical protein